MTDHELRSRTAHELHTRAIIFDAHNDSLVLKHTNGDPLDFGPADDRYHVDLPRLRQGGLTAFCNFVGARDLPLSLELWDALYWHVETYPEDFLIALTAADVRRAKAEGKIAFIGQLESCATLHQSLRVLSVQHRLGLRVANLVHFEGQAEHEHAVQVDKSLFDYTDAAAREAARHELKGLTGFGRDLIAACNDLGIVVDTAHANDHTFYEAVELSARPCIFSHGCVFALCQHWRGLTDDQIKALAAKGGVMGVAFYRKFIHPEDPTLERLIDQVEHVVNLVGPDHIGFGSDFDGLPEGSVPIPAHIGLLEEFTEGLVGRGFDEATVLKILGGNFLRVFEEVCG
jgi:membrane dipeptidase